MKKLVIAIIPARGGSKRILHKNIKPFCGKPIIAWSIETAIASGLFDHIIVSTDDTKIAEIAKEWGAEVPFLRPADLSNDHATTIDVMAHATIWAINQGWCLSAVCCIFATAPFIHVEDIKQGFETLLSGEWEYTFAVTDYSSPIFRSFKRIQDGGLEMLFPDLYLTRSQDLPVALHDAGQFYWGRPSAWIDGKPVFDRDSFPIFIPRWRVQDVDTMDDWMRAELMFKAAQTIQGIKE